MEKPFSIYLPSYQLPLLVHNFLYAEEFCQTQTQWLFSRFYIIEKHLFAIPLSTNGAIYFNFRHSIGMCSGWYIVVEFVKTIAEGECFWIWLDLFIDDTRPSGHISRPAQVNVSQSCFNSLNKLLKLNYIVQGLRLAELVSFQIEESHFSQEFHYACLGNCLEEGNQWGSCVVLITTFLYHCTLQEHMINDECLTTVVTSSGWSSGQNMGLGLANSKSGDYNLFSSG